MSRPLAPWQVLARRTLLERRWISVREDHVRLANGHEIEEFHVIGAPSWAGVLAVTESDEVVLVRQYRHGASRVTLEIPAGLVDPGEDPRDAAIRECLEESGYRATNAVSLGVVNPNPALFSNRLYAYLATDVEPVSKIKNVGTEQTEVVLVPVRRLAQMMLSGEIDHALVIATLWRYLYQHPPR